MNLISIVLAEDHTVVRQAIRLLLERENNIRLVGEASDGMEAVQLVERLIPNVLITDLMIPRLHGLEVIKQVRRHSPKTQVIVLSQHADESLINEAFHNGAAAYLIKDATATELLRAINDVTAGKRFLSSTLSARTSQAPLNGKELNAQDISDTLTSRERLVLQLAAEGLTSNQIAEKLYISPRTAETHRANLMRKLSISSQTELVRFAIRKGFINA